MAVIQVVHFVTTYSCFEDELASLEELTTSSDCLFVLAPEQSWIGCGGLGPAAVV